MDITSLFKASVKTVRTRIKALGTNKPEPEPSRILSRPIRDSKFQTRAKEIVASATKLKEFLAENRKSYLDAGGQLFNHSHRMSQAERAEVDATAQLILKNCNQLLNELKKEGQAPANAQTQQHRKIVVEVIEDYLKKLRILHLEQQDLYNKRLNDLHRVSKLEPDGPDHRRKHSFGLESSSCESPTDSVGSRSHVPYNQDLDPNEEVGKSAGFTVEEMQLFEKENAQLFNELNSLSEEVKQIQGRVVKIAELQQTLTEKVLEQDKDIERISTTTVGATENVREGNEQLRQAMQGNSGFRIALIFFLLVLSFSLLFLDWYNA